MPLARDVAAFALPAKPPFEPPPAVAKAAPLSAEEQKRFEAAKGIYEQVSCLPSGTRIGPARVGATVGGLGVGRGLRRADHPIIRIVLHGMRGKLKVKCEEYELDMPSLGVLDDEQVALVLNYVRREWGHTFPALRNTLGGSHASTAPSANPAPNPARTCPLAPRDSAEQNQQRALQECLRAACLLSQAGTVVRLCSCESETDTNEKTKGKKP